MRLEPEGPSGHVPGKHLSEHIAASSPAPGRAEFNVYRNTIDRWVVGSRFSLARHEENTRR
jgi:hypothetical protein